MMKLSHTRRGSALLVVLGMLAFMLFSGLAFSVYMRQSRLPTSFLRRTTTTRQLAKAALAEAMENLDKAIGNDPHPGLRKSGKAFDEDSLDNFWSHRVFIGQGTSSASQSTTEKPNEDNLHPAYVGADETIPTLTIEGLAYLPPNLINEARYYTRRTPTAKWHSFWFDSGRYAYSIIDVSDYFDVNRVFADRPRMACGPRRVTFAHLFESGYDHKDVGQGAKAWDEDFLAKFRDVDDNDVITFEGSKCPFVSLADLNMAWGSQALAFGGQTLQNPFYSFIKNGGIPYNCGESETDEAADKYRMLTFVTDGWFPIPTSTDETYGSCNLEDANYQPFRPDDLQQQNVSPAPMEVGFRLQYSPAEAQKWLKAGGNIRIPAPAMVALWDYLDVDSVPISLCMPTVERTPMVCGVKVSMPGPVDLEVEVTTEGEPNVEGEAGADGWTYATQVYTYKLKVSNLAEAQKDMQVLLTYPFRDHGMADELSRSFNLDGRLSVFLTEGEGEKKISIRPSSFQSYPKTKDDVTKAEFTDKALVSFPLRQQSVQPQEIVSENRDRPCIAKSLMIDPTLPSGDFTLAKVTYRWPYQQKDEEGNIKKTNEKPGVGETAEAFLKANTTANVNEADIGVFPLKQNGELKTAAELQEVLANKKSFKLKANVALWLRILDQDQNVVDYVPAWQQDDVNFIRGRSEDRVAESVGGSSSPLLRVVADDGTELAYSLAAFHGEDGSKGSLGSFAIAGTKLLVSDPRFNYAPENWFKVSGDASGNLDPADWASLAEGHARDGGGAVPADGDLFMATSDAGYMQSIYELAFVPRMSGGLNEDDINTSYQLQGIMPFKTLDDYVTFGQERDHDCMWRTYSMYGTSGSTRDELGELEDMFVSGSGTKVNPYSDSTKVLMAAFANTPHDWRVAATNNDALFEMTTDTFNGKHAWNDYSSDATGKICWDCLEELAGQFKQKVRSTKNWETAYRELGWGTTDDEHKSLGPVTVDQDDAKIYAVDKKFFYGFWRDCFAARQQLFLVFVRAEPMMMGGGVQGQTPPQLGARAVALVWRDPTPTRAAQNSGSSTSQTYAPHRMRILFYHQFD